MSKKHFGLTAMVAVILATTPQTTNADEWPTQFHRYRVGPHRCYHDVCGCPGISYEYHRQLWYTYGWHFDPRTFDQAEPYYYWGPVRAFRHYWCASAAAW
jgi:hypothetical protein